MRAEAARWGRGRGCIPSLSPEHTSPLLPSLPPPLLLPSQTSLRVLNMHYPPQWLRRMRAPPPAPRPLCLVSGLPARYRDPHTGQFFASAGALRRLRGGGGSVGGSGLFLTSSSSLPLQQQQAEASSLGGGAAAGSSLGSPTGSLSLASPRLAPPGVGPVTTQVDRSTTGARSKQVGGTIQCDPRASSDQ